jgi:hypothetical protein
MHLHLAFHHRLCDEPWASTPAKWVVPAYADPTHSVRTLAALLARRHEDGQVPYALDPANASIDPANGEVRLRESLGLTCSTFVVRLFEGARVPLVVESSWQTRTDARREEDLNAQTRLVSYLRKYDEAHAQAVAAQVGCTRIRAEEVAAASGLPGQPKHFAEVEAPGRQLLDRLE